VKQNLGNFKRTIAISPVAGYTNSLNQVLITVNYTTGRFTRTYSLTTYVSAN
jgi:hypothetical protein